MDQGREVFAYCVNGADEPLVPAIVTRRLVGPTDLKSG